MGECVEVLFSPDRCSTRFSLDALAFVLYF